MQWSHKIESTIGLALCEELIMFFRVSGQVGTFEKKILTRMIGFYGIAEQLASIVVGNGCTLQAERHK